MKHNKGAAPSSKPGRGKAADPLGTNSEIGRKLRQYYDELMSEDVPDRFTHLLNQLEERERSESSSGKD